MDESAVISEIQTTEPVPAPPPAEMGPVLGKERIEVMDILRGFAILGVLVVNYLFFYVPLTLMLTGFHWEGTPNLIVEKFVQFFFMGKFYTLFSFLFGLGFAVQIIRAESTGAGLAPVYRRRLFALLLFGILHGCLIWYGDILTTYAAFGFLLLLFRRRKQKTVVVWIIILLFIQMLLPAVRYTVVELMKRDPKKAAKMKSELEDMTRRAKEQAEDSRKIYSKGTYMEITEQRVMDYVSIQGFSLVFGGQFLMLFLIGLYVGRRGIFHNIPENLPFLRKVMWWGFGIGVPGNILFVISTAYTNPLIPSVLWTVAAIIYVFSVPALSFFYASGIAILIQNETWRRRLSPLGCVGRMALTNYLMHSVIGGLLFYSYGLGLFMKLGPAWTFLICIVIYSFQIPFSAWWLKRYRFGPMEWVWRSLTYGSLQAMRRTED